MARHREFDKTEVIGRAMLLFWEHGYEASSMRDLVDAMEISTSSLYAVFGDKRGVFLAALAHYCELERLQIAQMALDAPSPEHFVERLFGSVEDTIPPSVQSQGSLAFDAMVEFGTRDPDVTQLLLTHYFDIAQIVANVIKQGQQNTRSQSDPHELAYTILSTLYGVATLKGVKPDFAHTTAIGRLMGQLLRL